MLKCEMEAKKWKREIGFGKEDASGIYKRKKKEGWTEMGVGMVGE